MNTLGVKPSYATGFAQWPGQSEYPQLWTGLVGAWAPFLGVTGNKVSDLSGNGNTGTLAADTHWVPGKFGPALDFDGTGDYVDCGILPQVEGAIGLTVSVWTSIPTATIPAIVMLVGKRGDSGDRAFYLHARTTEDVYFGVYDTSNVEHLAWYVDGLLNKANIWTHLVGTYDGATVRVYVDGVVGTTTAAMTGAVDTSTKKMAIGADNGDTGGNEWLGQIDNVKIWNRALNPSEVALFYQIMKRYAA